MNSYDGPLPCTNHTDLYDAALFDAVPDSQRRQAIHRAAALCATCPAQCDQMVTARSAPRELVLLDPDWLPPRREGIPEPELPKAGVRRPRQPKPVSDYVAPGDRVTVWTSMAADLAADNTPQAIADILCVTVDTVHRLLARSQSERVA